MFSQTTLKRAWKVNKDNKDSAHRAGTHASAWSWHRGRAPCRVSPVVCCRSVRPWMWISDLNKTNVCVKWIFCLSSTDGVSGVCLCVCLSLCLCVVCAMCFPLLYIQIANHKKASRISYSNRYTLTHAHIQAHIKFASLSENRILKVAARRRGRLPPSHASYWLRNCGVRFGATWAVPWRAGARSVWMTRDSVGRKFCGTNF